MPPKRSEELALVQACVDGERAAWKQLVERYRPGVVAVARRTLLQANVEDAYAMAEDVAGEVFVTLLAKDCRTLASFEGRSGLGTWLGVLARRRAGKLLIKTSRYSSGRLDPQVLPHDSQRTPSQEASLREHKSALGRCLERLPQRDKLALQLYYQGQHSYREVAEVMGMPPAHVSSLLARARTRLAKLLKPLSAWGSLARSG